MAVGGGGQCRGRVSGSVHSWTQCSQMLWCRCVVSPQAILVGQNMETLHAQGQTHRRGGGWGGGITVTTIKVHSKLEQFDLAQYNLNQQIILTHYGSYLLSMEGKRCDVPIIIFMLYFKQRSLSSLHTARLHDLIIIYGHLKCIYNCAQSSSGLFLGMIFLGHVF